jgi:SAM-dependent methyltransferase
VRLRLGRASSSAGQTGTSPGASTGDSRTEAQLREQYLIEKELANRLRSADEGERRTLYADVYDELFRRVPHHPQLERKVDPGLTAAAVQGQIRLVSRFLQEGMTFLEVGSGDCAVSISVAETARLVYAVDVSAEIGSGLELPDNVRFVLSDGTSIPVPERSVDLAYSNQLMEHLHPEDALAQLRNIQRALVPGGRYLCITPNMLTGPHDISKYFDDVAQGFHLKEYTIFELRRLFVEAGFRRVTVVIGGRGRFVEAPPLTPIAFEKLLALFPPARRRPIVDRLHANSLLGIRIVGQK